MKMSLFQVLVVVSCVLLSSCDALDTLSPSASRLSFRTKVEVNGQMRDSILYRGSIISSCIDTSAEIVFADTLPAYYMRPFGKIACYLDNDSLFTFLFTPNTGYPVYNDLVLNQDSVSRRYYFKDGYPLNSIDGQAERQLNSQKRSAAWTRFIDQLKKEKRFVITTGTITGTRN